MQTAFSRRKRRKFLSVGGQKIQWHPGFVAAMELELNENRDDLIYEREYNLNTKPLEIDLLVIRKDQNVQIINEIGRNFRRYNIMEYKSPGAHLDIDAFYKAEAYACLYKAYGETVDVRKADDITVSIVRETRPEGLFLYFKSHGVRVESLSTGIYRVMDGVLFHTQIIVTKELDGKNHAWLKALSAGMDKRDMQELLKQVKKLTRKSEMELADSVLEVSVRANGTVVRELREGERNMYQALLELMEPEINKIKEEVARQAVLEGRQEGRLEGRQEGRQEGRLEGIQKGMQLIGRLYEKLTADGRTGEMQRVFEDEDYREQLLKEYGLQLVVKG